MEGNTSVLIVQGNNPLLPIALGGNTVIPMAQEAISPIPIAQGGSSHFTMTPPPSIMLTSFDWHRLAGCHISL